MRATTEHLCLYRYMYIHLLSTPKADIGIHVDCGRECK